MIMLRVVPSASTSPEDGSKELQISDEAKIGRMKNTLVKYTRTVKGKFSQLIGSDIYLFVDSNRLKSVRVNI